MRRRKLHSTAASIGEIGEDVASYMYNEIINDVLHCLDERFAEHSRPLYLALGSLQPKTPTGNNNTRFLNWTIVKPLYEKYKHLITDNALKVEMELNFLKTTLKTLPEAEGGQPSDTRGVWKYLEHQGRHFYRSVLILYRIAHSLPVVTASAERTFSRLNLVKTFLRSTMADERLGPLILLSLNKDISLDIEEIVDDFAKANNRPLQLH